MLDEEAIKKRVNEILPRRIVEGMITGKVPIMRNLETLIEQFNRASEIDRVSRIATGETYWAEVDGIKITMVGAWINQLSVEEEKIFHSYMAGVIDGGAKYLGFENAQEQFKDAGQKIFSGLEMGLTI